MSMPPLELWGGVECTVARIGDERRDQVIETGHRERAADLDAIAGLGIRTLRYPVIWETVAPGGGATQDWSWHDSRLYRLRDLGIKPIAGLVHHGSGPLGTSLLEPDFGRRLARFAEQVARRYPWIEDFTPVNEPLTTARFSALYGHWYPHQQSYAAFLAALVNQCRATVLAMRAIRRVTPGARLIQTDDLGKTFATPQLAYQAAHENERRWLAFDLLCGRLDRSHPWWRILRDHGISERQLAFFLDGEGAPDIIGVNHYLTSERFLDQRLHLYPPHLHGHNHREAYADVEAVRSHLPEEDLGPAARLREAWARYGRPVAVTEVHHGCTRDEQLRWLAEVWKAAHAVRAEGGDIRAVTLWSLFGTVDWNTLLTRRHGIYEPGAFDVRGPAPRPTALADAARQLSTAGRFDHPVLDRPGWWRRAARYYGSGPEGGLIEALRSRTLLVTGAAGGIATTFVRIAALRGLDCVVVPADDAAPAGLAAALARHRVWAVIDLALQAPHAGVGQHPSARLAESCARRGIPFVALSGDSVFDGRTGRPYRESSRVGSNGLAAAEAAITAVHPSALILRTGPLFGWGERNGPIPSMLARLADGRSVEPANEIVSPTYAPDFVHVALDLLIDGECGIRHLVNAGALSWQALAQELAQRTGLDAGVIGTAGPGQMRDRSLVTERGDLMPPLASALDRFLREDNAQWLVAPGVAAA